jgi:hypothetical protein
MCGAPKETLQHFLLECPTYAHKRWKLRPKKADLEMKFAEILANKKKIIALAHYMQATRRFTLEDQERVMLLQETKNTWRHYAQHTLAPHNSTRHEE